MENNKTTPETSVSTPESTQQATVNNSHQLSNNDIGIAGLVISVLLFAGAVIIFLGL